MAGRNTDLHDDIDRLARRVEQTIAETATFLSGLPEFESRSNRTRTLEQAYPEVTNE